MKKTYLFLIVSALLGFNFLLGAASAHAAEMTSASPTISEYDAVTAELQSALSALQVALNDLQYRLNAGETLPVPSMEIYLTLSQITLHLTDVSVALGPVAGNGSNYAINENGSVLSAPVLGDVSILQRGDVLSDLAVANAHVNGTTGSLVQWILNLRKPFLILLAFTVLFAVVMMLRRNPKIEVSPA